MAAFPDGISTVKLTFSAGFLVNGETPRVEALVRPLHRVTHVATGLPLIPFAVKAPAGADGLEIEIPNDSQAGFVDGSGHAVTQWGYKVDVSRSTGEGSVRDTVIRTVTFTEGQTVVDFDLIPAGAEVVDPVTGDFAVVTTVNGLSGDVIVTGGGEAVPVEWDAVLNKPTVFPVADHNHAIADVTGLQAVLDGKQPGGDYATTGELTIGLAGKQDAGDYVENTDSRLSDSRAPLPHSHAISNVTGLQDALDDKQATGDYVANNDPRLTDSRTPTVHNHEIADVNGLQSALDAASGGGGSPAWENITDKPTEFTPAAHDHAVSEVTGLQTALNGKQPTGDYATNTALTTGLAGKQPTGDYATAAQLSGKQDAGDYVATSDARLSDARTPVAHNHAVDDVNGLQTVLDGLQPAGDYVEATDARLSNSRTPLAHNHAVGDVTGLQDALDAKQPTGNYATTTDLTTGLAGKQPTGDYATNTSLTTGLSGKASTTHTHGIADLPAGTTITVLHSGTAWPTRPTSRTDVTVIWVGGTTETPPPGESTTDLWFKATT